MLNCLMSDDITGVLLADGWHDVEWFQISGPEDFEEFMFESGPHVYAGPVSSILAVKFDPSR